MRLFSRPERFEWELVPDSERETGPIHLERNGDYRLGPMLFDQCCAITDCRINGLVVSKAAGPGQVLAIDGPSVKIRLMFTDGRWHYLRRA